MATVLDDEAKVIFHAVVPQDPRVTIKAMFGSLAGFIKGNMFTGLKGKAIFVRLPEELREELLQQGAADFSPMPGRPMKEYVSFPEQWDQEPDKLREWIQRSLEWAETLPEKLPAAKSNKAKS